MILFTDIEADSLNPKHIWVVCVNGQSFLTKESFLEFFQEHQQDTWVFHNGIFFDCPVLKDLWGIEIPRDRVLDTLVLGRLIDPSRQEGHSLKAYGEYLGFPKGDHSDWSQLTQEMVDYCLRDVQVTKATYEYLMKQEPSKEAIELEHQVAWVISDQVRNGWLLDQRKCFAFLGQLKERLLQVEQSVLQRFRPLPVSVKEIEPKFKADGALSVVGLKFLGDQFRDVSGVFTRVDWPEFNLGSRQQIGRYLQHFGWEPKEFTETGQAKVDETVLEGVKIPEAQMIAEYLMLQKRIAMVESWLELVKPDGRVHGEVKTNGAVTGRMTHSNPNMAQVTANGKPWGKECRECWIAKPGYVLVGVDASGLELRMLAHYMNDAAYTNELLTGDIHTRNQKAAGLETRPQAKTFIYAFLYGAGDEKIGSIVGKGAKEGRKLKEEFLGNVPALKELREQVSRAAQRGYLFGLDKRKLHIRSEHAALNTLLQSAGAIVMKKALCILNQYAKLQGLDFKFVGNIHDEIQTEVRADHARKFGWLAVECIKAAGLHFNLKCPLDGEYHIGNNWSETH